MAYYRKYLNYFLNKNLKKVKWGYVIFFVTNRCNSKCKHCFYWQELNSGNELSINEIEKISSKFGQTQVLLLSGGEPFLRDDLFEIISLFIKNNGVKVVSIPTNGLLTNKITEITQKLSQAFPKITFSINPSIDALYEKNDDLRGVQGSFTRSIQTVKELEKIKKQRKNVEIVVNTTISNFNYRDIDDIIDFFKQFNITYHNFELLRGNPKEKSVLLPPLDEIKKIHLKAINIRNYYIKKNSGLLEKIIVLGVVKYTQSLKEKFIKTGAQQIKCSAGKNVIVLEPNGDVRLCELHPSVGNLREYNYDIEELLKNEKAGRMFKIIEKCGCTHVCFINMSIANDKKSLFKIPYYFLKWKK
ncbi:MAG: radical SAM/SPASM domain-containing protein [Patescibacteria group bacterium]|jgi:MoaA/NifB/PqqE/SkfB family radical SAM enzyme